MTRVAAFCTASLSFFPIMQGSLFNSRSPFHYRSVRANLTFRLRNLALVRAAGDSDETAGFWPTRGDNSRRWAIARALEPGSQPFQLISTALRFGGSVEKSRFPRVGKRPQQDLATARHDP